MRSVSKTTLGVLVVALASALTAGCRDNQDPAGAEALWDRVSTSGYESWPHPPRHPGKQPSFTLHSGSVEIFLNPVVADAYARGTTRAAGSDAGSSSEFPVGSLVVKNGYSGNGSKLSIVAVMEKRTEGWYFAEYSADGTPLFSGRPAICLDCHEARKDYSDWLFTLELPR
jgi:hypothetical protein